MSLSSSVRTALVIALSIGIALPAIAHETDQYTLPTGREFADLGDHFTGWVFGAIERGVNKTNARIRIERAAGRDGSEYHTPDAIATAVNREFPFAIFLIEDLDKQMTSTAMKDRYPGYLPGYKPPPSMQKFLLYPLNPFRAWNCSTVKVFGVYLGTDKIGHFTDMGMHYYQTYRGYLRKGESEAQAMRRAIAVGRDDPLKGESKLLGYWTAGAYSNADMAINYVGMLFYRNLTEAQTLKGELRPPMLVLQDGYWKIEPHVRADSDFFAYFISEHLDEALNPSHYLSSMRDGMRKMAADNAESILEMRKDAYGNRRSKAYFRQLSRELRTYWGVDYGHRGEDAELILIADVCFPQSQPAGSENPHSRDALGRTPLHRAAEFGETHLVAQLLEAGSDVNAQVRSDESRSAEWGNTPLHLAALNGHDSVVKLLIDRGANVNASNDRGATPLHLAAQHPHVIPDLIQANAGIDARDAQGRTPLHWAAVASKYDGVSLLLESGADVNGEDSSGMTPLHLAARSGRAGSVAELIRRGADAARGDGLGVTPLHLATATRAESVVEILVQGGAPLDVRDSLGCTPLHEATRRQSHAMVALLLDAGAQPTLADAYGATPLHLAGRQGNESVARLLLQSGADAHVRAGSRGTPIDEAARAGHRALAALLRDDESRADVARSQHR